MMVLNDLTALTGILSVRCKKILKTLKWVGGQMPFLKQTADEYRYEIQWWNQLRSIIRLINGHFLFMYWLDWLSPIILRHMFEK